MVCWQPGHQNLGEQIAGVYQSPPVQSGDMLTVVSDRYQNAFWKMSLEH